MPFTVAQIENIANAAIDFHFKRGTVYSQTIQNKPLLKALVAKEKTFPGGKGNVTVRVKGVYSTTIQGFSNDDTVGYVDPTNIRTANYPYKLIHAGISFTMDELIRDGITVTDSLDGKNTSDNSEREMTALANMLEDKLEDMQEGVDRGFQTMYWQNGTQDSNLIPGLQSIVTPTPLTSGVVGGIDPILNSWWQNRATLGINSTATPSNLNLINTLQFEYRQLRRFGGDPKTFLAGSAFLTAMEGELRSKGNFTLEGWAQKSIDASVDDLKFKGTTLEYDPSLDDLGLSKYGFWIDLRHIFPMVIQGENMKKHAPARPENKYVFYRAVTYAGALVCRQRNSHGVYSIL